MSKKARLVSVFIVIVGCLFAWIDYRINVDLNKPSNMDRTEIMLWDSPKTSFESRFKFDFNITPENKSIKIAYKIINASDKPIVINNTMDLAVVDADESKAGDLGKAVWLLSKSNRRMDQKPINLKPYGIFQDEVSIDREKIDLKNLQYYIDAYFNGES